MEHRRAAPRRGKRGQRLIQICTGAPMTNYEEMSPTDRGNLFEGLASLSGLQEGPKNRHAGTTVCDLG